ncbi:ribose-5-phosphate isomerase RpiA [Flexithrix dorotheae]|uniref:ribose-5-phosphate isomerase RpiA n=1 Tax=Flexithrix dorotheae TaxID=70993 RepID=UPI00036ACF39|nr:ribose-5-phosphate isomerase RpiA [Flexithrix dorotheae]
MSNSQVEKKLAAEKAVSFLKDGMVVGLGTGNTAEYAIKAIGELVKKNGLRIKGIPTSENSKKLAETLGIPLTDFSKDTSIDITIDGADEFDPYLRLIKGGGGALLREKIVASATKKNIVIVDASKKVNRLGKFLLPVEIIPFAKELIIKKLEELGLSPKIRMDKDRPFLTDENNLIIDLNIIQQRNLEYLEKRLKSIPGIVETGLFLSTTGMVIMGEGNEVKTFE